MFFSHWLSETIQILQRNRRTSKRRSTGRSQARRGSLDTSAPAVENLETRALLTATTFWQDNFEGTTPNLGGGTRTPQDGDASGSLASEDYFMRTTDATTAATTPFTGHSGNLWRAEDVDLLTGSVGGVATLNWTGINIAGKTDLKFSGLFGALDNLGVGGFHRFETPDFLTMEYSVDGGGFVELLDYRNDESLAGTPGSSGNLAIDTDGNDVGNTPVLCPALASFMKDLTGVTGTTLALRVRTSVGGSNEEVAFDTFTLTEVIAGAPEIDVRGLGNSIGNHSCDGVASDTLHSVNAASPGNLPSLGAGDQHDQRSRPVESLRGFHHRQCR